MNTRYDRMFAQLSARGEGAFIPFLTLGDPDLTTSARLLAALIAARADALELGLPFSDPVADGPVIQASARRALDAGVRMADCFALIATVRHAAPDLPIGLLVYANLVVRRGVGAFYREAAKAGVDSVLIADVPLAEAERFAEAAAAAGIAAVLIAPPNASPAHLAEIGRRSRGYTYVTSRDGVTGDDRTPAADLRTRLAALRHAGAAPPVVGFGISTPTQVRSALAAGAQGVITGSALVRRIEARLEHPDQMVADLEALATELKAATRGGHATTERDAHFDRVGIVSGSRSADY